MRPGVTPTGHWLWRLCDLPVDEDRSDGLGERGCAKREKRGEKFIVVGGEGRELGAEKAVKIERKITL